MLLMQSCCSPVMKNTNTQIHNCRYTNTQYKGGDMDAADAILLFTGDNTVGNVLLFSKYKDKHKYANSYTQMCSKRHSKGGGMDTADAILLFTGDNPAGKGVHCSAARSNLY